MKGLIVFSLLVLSSILFLPYNVSAQDPAGLVTCSGPDCDFCAAMQLIEVVINWLFGFLVLVAVLILMWAGFKMVISGGNVSAWQSAKTFLTNIIIGFVIILAAWLIVDTLMKALVNPDAGFGPWNELSGQQCGGFDGVADGVNENDNRLYCYDLSGGRTTNVRGRTTCEEYLEQSEDEGEDVVRGCYVCGIQ